MNLSQATILLLAMVSAATAATNVAVLITVDATIQDMMKKNTEVIDSLTTTLGGTVTCYQVCDRLTLTCHTCGLSGLSSQEQRTHIATYYTQTERTDLNVAASDTTTALKAVFGAGNVKPTLINDLQDGTAPEGVDSAVTVAWVTYETTIDLYTLRDNHQALVATTQLALGGEGAGFCDRICEMKPLNPEGTLFGDTPRCYNCDGTFMSRDVNTLETARWKVTVTAAAPTALSSCAKDNCAAQLLQTNTQVRNYFIANGGELHSISVVVEEGTGESDDEITGNTIAAIVVGCVGFVVVLIVIVFACCFRKADPEPEQEELPTKDAPDTPPETA